MITKKINKNVRDEAIARSLKQNKMLNDRVDIISAALIAMFDRVELLSIQTCPAEGRIKLTEEVILCNGKLYRSN
jgi:hypothetical protein